MKINIFFDYTASSYGGGNQFLKALRNELIRTGCFEEDPKKANGILFNSHHHLDDIIRIKRKFIDKVFVHRVDGPMSYRGIDGEKIDKKIFYLNKIVADGTVFQSEWSRFESQKQGMKNNRFETIIRNASDSNIYYPVNSNHEKSGSRKIKLITTSWSSNPGKGFDIYHYLDNNLDFRKYEMTFVGQSERKFNNIRMVPPVSSIELAGHLRKHDIFVFASKREACSNSLIEALTCGLPAVVRNCSSNPEVISDNGLIFEGKDDVLTKIKAVADNLDYYSKKLNIHGIKEVTENYCQFFETVFTDIRDGVYRAKRVGFLEFMLLKTI